MFLQSEVQKSGKNMHLSFKYFELEDIVPPITKIFSELGLISIVKFDENIAKMIVTNTDNGEESIEFTAPFTQITPIVSNTGKQATNEMQALGSSITYMRRYLYMIAMDIVENDSIDANIGFEKPKTQIKPATPEEREKIKKEITAPEGNATPLQIKSLKTVLKKLKDANPHREEMIAKIAIETKGFTSISKADCEKLIEKTNKMLEKETKNEEN